MEGSAELRELVIGILKEEIKEKLKVYVLWRGGAINVRISFDGDEVDEDHDYIPILEG